MRGTHAAGVTHKTGVRFIPAYAGNALKHRVREKRQPVHPRVCGERQIVQRALGDGLGSSPRMRGTRGQAGLVHPVRRFIPAYAGNATAAR